MGLLSSIAAKLRIPVFMQALLLVVVGFCYLSSEHELRDRRQQTRQVGEMITRLQAVTMNVQLFLHGQGEFGKIDAELREQTGRTEKLSIGGSLVPPMKRMSAVLQESSKYFQRNAAIEAEVIELTKFSIEKSDRFIVETSALLADPAKERKVPALMRSVLADASVNSGINHDIQTLFLRMKSDGGKRQEMLSFLDTAINICVAAAHKLAGTPFVALPEKALSANKRIRELVLEYQSNLDKIAVASQEIERQSGLMRGELDRFSEKSMMAGYDFLRVRIISLLVVVFVAAATLAVLNWSLSRSILQPIAKMTAVLRNISQGEGDLTQRLPIAGRDEISEACRLFNTFVEKLQGIIGQVAQTASAVTGSTRLLSATSSNLASATEEMSAKADTLATASEQMAATITDIALNCNLAADNSQQANAAAVLGAQVVESTIAGMQRIAANTRLSASTVSSLGVCSEQIGEIVATIEDIADQTNLLALNAAIEAARAGEQGRGFAVVADEVRALAERTTNATKEIGTMIRNIQSETRKAVAVMEGGVAEVGKGTEDAARSGEALREIIDKINAVAMQVSQVATAAEQQNATTTEITNNILQMTRVVQGSSQGARESAAATLQLSTLAGDMQNLMSQFKL